MAIQGMKATEVKPGDIIVINGQKAGVTSVEPTRSLSGVIDGTRIQTTSGLKVVGKGGEVLVAREGSSTPQIENAKSETNQNSKWFFGRGK